MENEQKKERNIQSNEGVAQNNEVAVQSNEGKILTIGKKTVTPEMIKDRKEYVKEEKTKLEAMLKSGAIDGAEYNRRVVELEVPEVYKPKYKMPKKHKIWTLMVVLAIMLVASIPAAINLNWRFYFKNTLTAKDVPDYGHFFVSSLDDAPIQKPVGGLKETGEYKGRPISISYKYYYDIRGVVTSVHDYWGFSDYDSLVPRDVCIAWGSLKDLYLDGKAEFYQQDRYCIGRVVGGGELDAAEVFTFRNSFGQTQTSVSSVSNNHLIASTASIRDQIFGLRAGDKVRITGYLIDAAYGSIELSSSTTRSDTGNGACEIIYVTGVEKLN